MRQKNTPKPTKIMIDLTHKGFQMMAFRKRFPCFSRIETDVRSAG